MGKTRISNAADIDAATFLIDIREPELEGTLGEIIVADFQTKRLRNVLSDKAAGYIHAGGGYYRKNQKNNNTTNTFRHKGKLYRISILVQEIKF